MEHALKGSFVTQLPAAVLRLEDSQKASDKIIAFTGPQAEFLMAISEPVASTPVQRDWSSALDLIQEASEAIRLAESRAADLQERLQRVTAQAALELRNLEAQVASASTVIKNTEDKARLAELRAVEAETWLARLHDAVTASFTRQPRPAAAVE